MFQTLIYVAIFVIVPLFSASNGSATSGDSIYAQYTPFASVVVIFLSMLILSLNTLGIERQSLTTLFLFPIERRRLLWGKNLAVLLLGLALLVVLMLVCVIFSRQQSMILPATIIGLAGMGVTLGSGNLSSVYFPRYQRAIGQRGYSATGGQAQSGGCLNQVMSLVMLVTTAILLVPVALGIGIPFFLNMQWLWLAAMPLSLAYGLGLYVLFTNLAAKRLLAMEPEILAITTRE
jgi:ABC-2 type transport system permease protein